MTLPPTSEQHGSPYRLLHKSWYTLHKIPTVLELGRSTFHSVLAKNVSKSFRSHTGTNCTYINVGYESRPGALKTSCTSVALVIGENYVDLLVKLGSGEKHGILNNYVEYCDILMQILFCRNTSCNTR